jgi:hypothetical protein
MNPLTAIGRVSQKITFIPSPYPPNPPKAEDYPTRGEGIKVKSGNKMYSKQEGR